MGLRTGLGLIQNERSADYINYADYFGKGPVVCGYNILLRTVPSLGRARCSLNETIVSWMTEGCVAEFLCSDASNGKRMRAQSASGSPPAWGGQRQWQIVLWKRSVTTAAIDKL
jgi:hypothetical protein